MKDLFTELQLPVKGPKLIDMSTFFDDVEKLNIDPSEIIDLDFDKPDPKKIYPENGYNTMMKK